MEQEISEQFTLLNQRFDDMMDFLSEHVATKEDTGKLEVRMLSLEQGFEELRNEMRSIDQRLSRMEEEIKQLHKTVKEDVDALAKDFLLLKRRVDTIERTLKTQGVHFA